MDNNSDINKPAGDSEDTLKTVEKLTQVSEAIRSYSTESWNQLPNIELYMDQVVTYLERLLNITGEVDATRNITSSMVNNYVKEGFLSRPVKKKYDRGHLASLYIMAMLKPVLPIPLIAEAISDFSARHDSGVLFEKYGRLQDEAFDKVSDRLDSILSDSTAEYFNDDLRFFALQLITEANACQIAAEKILTSLSKARQAQKEQKDKELKDKKEPKDKK